MFEIKSFPGISIGYGTYGHRDPLDELEDQIALEEEREENEESEDDEEE